MLSQGVDYQIRQTNKEPEWSSICNNVFDQYLDDTDLPLGFDASPNFVLERSSSNDSGDLFNFSGGSEQSNQTIGTSPIPAWASSVVQTTESLEAKQPKAKEPADFWTRTLRALEKNAAECEQRERNLRAIKSHDDYSSLRACPSPQTIRSSPTDSSSYAERYTSRGIPANGRKASQARSGSRGRPSGVNRTAVTPVNPCPTVRKRSASPPKMMNPSRYRAGFKDVWKDRGEVDAKKYELTIPSQVLPILPHPSAGVQHDDFAAFGLSAVNQLFPACEQQLSPLTTAFQHAHINAAIAPPQTDRTAQPNNSYFEVDGPVPPDTFAPQRAPLNDTAPFYPESTASLAANKIQAFDFGFSSSPDLDGWNRAPFAEVAAANYTTDQCPVQDPFGDVLPSTEPGSVNSGLGIRCDLSQATDHPASADTASLLADVYHSNTSPYCLVSSASVAPSTPRRRSESCIRSQSPSPPLTHEPKSRRTSRHRRSKSATSTPRHSVNLDKGKFVNFTAHDSGKILSGVAPSGSSKTKARREKEAADRRRRLSQAAVRAVVEAGGDLEGLRRDGLLV